jgi:transposase-like protein
MNLTTLSKKYNTNEKCIKYLEKLRWNNKPICPFCLEREHITKRHNTISYHCNSCNSDFTVLYGTIFEGTRLELPKWFQLIMLMLNAKKGISAKQLMRDVEIGYSTAWYCAMRVRSGMIDHCNILLENIVEMDESYTGGKPRKHNIKVAENAPVITQIAPNKRGRGTKKTPIVGIVERKGKIALKVIEKLTGRNLLAMLKEYVNVKKTILMTDENPSYHKFDDIVEHYTVTHSKKEYVRGTVHTNTIEGFWAIVKNSIRGQYIAISKKYLPFYLVQAQYLYNNRDSKNDLFEEYLINALSHEKHFENYKPDRPVKKIVYGKCKIKIL